MADAVRITPQDARQHYLSKQALIVCAYDSEETFNKVRLEGAISLNEFKQLSASLPRDREIIFYCA